MNLVPQIHHINWHGGQASRLILRYGMCASFGVRHNAGAVVQSGKDTTSVHKTRCLETVSAGPLQDQGLMKFASLLSNVEFELCY